MSGTQGSPFRLDETYAFLKDGGSAPLVPTAGLWQELMSGQPKSEGAMLLSTGDGWLVALYTIDTDTPAWEMHPSGDELLTMLSGEMEVVFERAGGEASITIRTGETCRVPRGTWHRQVVRQAGRYLGMTYGRGTQHRGR